MRDYIRKIREVFRHTDNVDGGLDWSIDWNRKHPQPLPEDLVGFWRSDHLRNITPPSTATPAGFDEALFLKRLWPSFEVRTVVEIGCGYGRLASAFPVDGYLGLDINPEAIARARTDRPDYRFQSVDFDSPYPDADLYIAYTVFLHIDDANIADINRRVSQVCKKLLIVEVLDREFRTRPSVVPNFVRTRDEYERIFDGFSLDFEIRKPYRHYPGKDIGYLLFEKKVAS